MSRTPITKIAIPVPDPKGGFGLIVVDVHELGFLDTEELRRDPDSQRYVRDYIKRKYPQQKMF